MAQSKIEMLLELKDRISSGLNKAKAAVSEASENIRKKINGIKTYWVDAFKEMREQIPLFDQACKFLSNPIGALVTAAVGIGSAVKSAVTSAMDWQKGMAQINVTAGLTTEELDKMSNKMLEIGARNVAPLEEVPAAFNKIISAGLNAEQALGALEPTLRAAKAGFTDIETVAAAGVNVMNSSGAEINEVYDVLFATLSKGAANMSEIASYLPTVVPTAKNAGVSLNETAGAFAYMTAQGQSASAAATLLNGAFNSLANPKLHGNFQAIGVEIYDAEGKMRPMTGIIEDLAKSLDGLSDKAKAEKLSSLGLDQTSAQGLAVMTQNVEKFKSTLDATANSQGALNDAYDHSMTASDYWSLALNNVKELLIKVGQKFLPIVNKIGEFAASITSKVIPAIRWLKDLFVEWWPVIAGVAGAIAVLNAANIAAAASMIKVSVVTGLAAAKQWLLNIAMSANPIGIMIVAIGALIGLIVALCKKYEGWTTVWNFTKVLLVNSFTQFWEDTKEGFKSLWYYIELFWLNIKSFGQYIGQLFGNIASAIKAALTGNFSEAKRLITAEITTEAEEEIKALKQQRQKEIALYESGKAKRALEIKEAWDNISLTKKVNADESNAESADSVIPGIVTEPEGNGEGSGEGTGGSKGTGTGAADSVAGSAKQIRNITVNIDAFNKGGINTTNTQGLSGMSSTQIEDWFNNMFLKAIRNLETSY